MVLLSSMNLLAEVSITKSLIAAAAHAARTMATQRLLLRQFS